MLRKGHILAISVVTISLITFLSIEAQQELTVPTWVKNNAKWWAEGAIDDDSFVSGIEFLISEGVIDVPITQKTVNPTDEIPTWIKTNANWWADGLISDSDFVKGIEFLVNSGIIQVELPDQSQIDPPSLQIDAGPSDDTVDTTLPDGMCSGNARCITGTVTQVIDGDTIKVDGKSIRFTLASAPELNEPGGIEARNFIETICSVGSTVIVDEDDGQTEGSYDRILGVIYCNGVNLNQDLLDVGHGYLISDFCDKSEFADEDWAQKHGCSTSLVSEFLENGCTIDYPYLWSDGLCYNLPEFLENGCPRDYPYLWSDGSCYTLPEYFYEEPADTTPSCDPSYPDVCIPPYPPDLDCDEVGYSNFRVTGYDPHGFDADYDGIGCEVGSPQSANDIETTPSCDPSYPDVCIAPYPPDLNCGDIPYKNFKVVGSDPHGFDGDNDGIGCES